MLVAPTRPEATLDPLPRLGENFGLRGCSWIAPGLARRYTRAMDERILILRGSAIGRARLPTDAEVLECLRRLSVPEEALRFRIANEFKAPGVFEQTHSIAGSLAAGAIKEEEEERGAGEGSCYYIFCKDRDLEIYLAQYSGGGGEIAILDQSDPKSTDVCEALSRAMGGIWPSSDGSVSRVPDDRVTLHLQRRGAMRGHVQEWFGR